MSSGERPVRSGSQSQLITATPPDQREAVALLHFATPSNAPALRLMSAHADSVEPLIGGPKGSAFVEERASRRNPGGR
jgi:hypothetical protein